MMKKEPYARSNFFFLEDVATRERQKIEKLTFIDEFSFLLDCDGPISVEDRIQHIDQCFLTFLFRPSHPRGTGTVLPPLPHHIRRGLMKLNRTRQSYLPNNSTSIELETLKVVQDWRRKDASRMHPKTPTKQSYTRGGNELMSIYDSVVKPSRHESEEVLDIVELEQTQVDGDWRMICQDHESRWRSLLIEIWEQERRERSQLCFAAINADTDKAIVVRAGSISIVRYAELPGSTELLDEASWNIISTMEGSTVCSAVAEFERLVCEYVRRGNFGIDVNSMGPVEVFLAETCQKLSPMLSELLTADELSEIEDINFSTEDAQRISHLPVIQLLSLEKGLHPFSNNKNCLSTQQRLAAAGLTIRTVDILRRLFLGRLVVLQATTGDFLPDALRIYLRCVTSLYTSTQRVEMRFISPENRSLQPIKFGLQTGTFEPVPGTSSVLAVCGVREKTVSIDSLLIYLSDVVTMPSGPGFTYSATQLASDAIHRYLCDSSADGSPFNDVKLPELASIPPSSGDVTDDPKLALRLLAINMSLPDLRDNRILENKRKHIFAMSFNCVSNGK